MGHATKFTPKQDQPQAELPVQALLKHELTARLQKEHQWTPENEALLAQFQARVFSEETTVGKRYVLELIVPKDEGVYCALLNEISNCKKRNTLQNGSRFQEDIGTRAIFSSQTMSDISTVLNETLTHINERFTKQELLRRR